MRARLFVVAALAAVSAAFAGCSLLTDTTGLVGSSASVDGATDSPLDVSAADASADAIGDALVDVRRPDPTWRPTNVGGPPARHSSAMAFDGKHVVLFGGTMDQNASNFSDTWIWDGASWSSPALSTHPPSSYGHSMVYDDRAKLARLVSGRRSGPNLWTFDDAAWTPIDPPTRLPLVTAKAAFDSARNVVVAFAGYANTAEANETWELAGGSWTQRTPAASPPVRRGHVMAYDSARAKVVMFGGDNHTTGSFGNDTWEYDGTTWTEKKPATVPASRRGACAAFDASRGVTVMFGGLGSNGMLSDTWEWDGNDWRRGPDGPPKRRSCAMAFDPTNNQIVLFGGVSQVSGDGGFWRGNLGDTWLY